MNKVACAVMVFDRPQYFKPVLGSLKKSTQLDNVDWYFYFDNTTTIKGVQVGDIKGSILCLSHLDDFGYENITKIRINEYNYGIAKQKQQMHELFDFYDQVIFFEDDMIVSPHYITLMINMQKQFPNCMVSAPARKKDKIVPDATLKQVQVSNEHFWGYSLKRESFLKIKDKYNQYCKDVGDNYKKRPHTFLKEKYNMKISSHDCALGTFFAEEKIERVVACVPRGRYIGKEGTNFHKSTFEAAGFDEDREIIFSEDESITEFECMTAEQWRSRNG